MAEDMIERCAMYLAWTERAPSYADLNRADFWRYCGDNSKLFWRERASRALLAAIDPEDEALVADVAHAIGLMDYFGEEPMPPPTAPALRVTREKIEHFSFLARAALVALKRLAQGEQPVHSDMREKDKG